MENMKTGDGLLSKQNDFAGESAREITNTFHARCALGYEKSPQSTIQRAAEERAKQGTHQLEISFGGTRDLHKHFIQCDKNPGHYDFVPVHSLHRWHLPVELWKSPNSVFSFCRYFGQLAVKLRLEYPSPHRSEMKYFPLSDCAGQRILGSGSGCVTGIDRYTSAFPCPLQNCCQSSKPHDVFGYIVVTTAAHVVLDDSEAVETTVLFFDDDPVDKKGVEKAHGVKVRSVSIEGDFCELLCVTHSRDLYERLTDLLSCPPHLSPAPLQLSGMYTYTEHDWDDMKRSLVELMNALIDIRQKVSSCLGKSNSIVSQLKEIVNTLRRYLKVYRKLVSDATIPNILLLHRYMTEKQNEPMVVFIKEKIQWLLDITDKKAEKGVESWGKEPHTIMSHFKELINFIGSMSLNNNAPNYPLQNLLRPAEKLQRLQESLLVIDMQKLCVDDLIVLGLMILCLLVVQFSIQPEFYVYVEHLITEISDQFNALHISSNIPVRLTSYDEVPPLVIHISHPHGQSKQITFGMLSTFTSSSGSYKYIYTVPTCNGGSGGPVWIIPIGREGDIDYHTIYGVPHSGCYDYENKLNHSCSWTFYPPCSTSGSAFDTDGVPKTRQLRPFVDSRGSVSTANWKEAMTSDTAQWMRYLFESAYHAEKTLRDISAAQEEEENNE